MIKQSDPDPTLLVVNVVNGVGCLCCNAEPLFFFSEVEFYQTTSTSCAPFGSTSNSCTNMSFKSYFLGLTALKLTM